MVPREDRLQPLLEEDVQRGAQPIQHVERRRVGEIPLGVMPGHVPEVEEHPGQPGRLTERQRPGARRDDREAGRQHEPLLRPGDRDIHPPLIHPEVEAPDRAHPIHHEQRRVARGVDRAAGAGHVAGDPGGGFVVHHHHRLDAVPAVLAQRVLDPVQRSALPPLGLEHLDVQAETLGHVDPEVAELAEAGREHLVARGEGVGQRGLPASGAAGGKDEGLGFGGLEHPLEILEQPQRQGGEAGGAVIFHRDVHRAEHPVRHVGGTRNKEMITAWHVRSFALVTTRLRKLRALARIIVDA